MGKWGERLAARHLRGKGYRILGRRVRMGRRDELDIVARDGDSLVFVEVKARSSETYGRPVASVDREKRQALSRAAVAYLQKLKFPPLYFRFDVVEVVGECGAAQPSINHIENAFTLDGRYQLPF